MAKSNGSTHQGSVVWFSEAKGYGFIRPEGAEDDTQDIFVHYTAVDNQGQGRRNLNQGQRVEYQIGKGRQDKPMATHVIVVEPGAVENNTTVNHWK